MSWLSYVGLLRISVRNTSYHFNSISDYMYMFIDYTYAEFFLITWSHKSFLCYVVCFVCAQFTKNTTETATACSARGNDHTTSSQVYLLILFTAVKIIVLIVRWTKTLRRCNSPINIREIVVHFVSCIYQQTQRTLAVCTSSVHQLVQATFICYDFVQCIWVRSSEC